MAQILDAARTALDAARRHQADAARLIQEGNLTGCMQPLSHGLRQWQQARDAADSLLKAAPPESAQVEEAERLSAELAQCLGEVKRALGVEDWSALSDALAYDLDTLAARWQTLLVSLSDRSAP
jgi:hypothetical protein